jgi:hypothetical protein
LSHIFGLSILPAGNEKTEKSRVGHDFTGLSPCVEANRGGKTWFWMLFLWIYGIMADFAALVAAYFQPTRQVMY